MPLTLAQANALVAAALKHSAAQGYAPMAVVVLDESGHVRTAQREDGASMFRIDIASGKAWGAVAMGLSSRELKSRAEQLPAFFQALASTSAGKLIPQTGAVLLKDADGKLLGAIGASGGTGDQDEEICLAAAREGGWRTE